MFRVSNSLNPDQARRSVGPDLGPSLLAKVNSRRYNSPLVRKEIVRYRLEPMLNRLSFYLTKFIPYRKYDK